MSVETPRPEGILSPAPALAPPASTGGIAESFSASIAPLVAFPPRLFRDGLPGPPLRI